MFVFLCSWAHFLAALFVLWFHFAFLGAWFFHEFMSMGASGGLEAVSASGQLVLSIIKSEFSFVENCLVMAHFFRGGELPSCLILVWFSLVVSEVSLSDNGGLRFRLRGPTLSWIVFCRRLRSSNMYFVCWLELRDLISQKLSSMDWFRRR